MHLSQLRLPFITHLWGIQNSVLLLSYHILSYTYLWICSAKYSTQIAYCWYYLTALLIGSSPGWVLDDTDRKYILSTSWRSSLKDAGIQFEINQFVQLATMSSKDQSVTIQHQLDTVLINIAELRCSLTDLFYEQGGGASIRSKNLALEAQLEYYKTLLNQKLFIIQNLELFHKAALAMIASAQPVNWDALWCDAAYNSNPSACVPASNISANSQ